MVKRRDLKSSFADAEYTPDYILSLTAAVWGWVPVCQGGGGSGTSKALIPSILNASC